MSACPNPDWRPYSIPVPDLEKVAGKWTLLPWIPEDELLLDPSAMVSRQREESVYVV